MIVKVLLFGEAVSIPSTNLGLGVAFISVWVDNNGFESAANSIGSLGYILLETQSVDIGSVDADKQVLFSNLHGRVVKFDITPNTFLKSGGIARIVMTISVQQGGQLVDNKIEFQADNCRGVCLVSNALSFSCEMLQMEKPIAMQDNGLVLSDDAVTVAANSAPAAQDGSGASETASAAA